MQTDAIDKGRPRQDLRANDREINAFVEIFDDQEPQGSGALSGLSFGVKEVIEQKGRKTPLGVAALYDRPGQIDAHVVAQALAAGAARVGTTRSTVMAIAGDSGTRNPLDTKRSPGGSSAGSAAAVAAGLVDFAFGTQTVGSIVRPASYCNVPGFKPSFDALSTAGVMCLARELDHVGIIGRDLDIVSRVFRELTPETDGARAFTKVFVPPLWFAETAHPAAAKACGNAMKVLHDLGLASSTQPLPEVVTDLEEEVLKGLLCHGIFGNHRAFLEANGNAVPEELMALFRLGSSISAEDHSDLVGHQEMMRRTMDEAIPEDAVVLMPSVIDLPPLLGHGTGLRQPQRLWTLLGWPVVSVPAASYGGASAHLKISVQLVGKPGSDRSLLGLARMLHHALRQASA